MGASKKTEGEVKRQRQTNKQDKNKMRCPFVTRFKCFLGMNPGLDCFA